MLDFVTNHDTLLYIQHHLISLDQLISYSYFQIRVHCPPITLHCIGNLTTTCCTHMYRNHTHILIEPVFIHISSKHVIDLYILSIPLFRSFIALSSNF